MRPTPIVYIGGVSAAGKTSAARKAGQRHAIPVVELDEVYRTISRPVCDHGELGAVMAEFSAGLLRSYLEIAKALIVEGVWLPIAAAAALQQESGDFSAIFLGYSSAGLSRKRASVHRSSHWLRSRAPTDADSWLIEEAARSQQIEADCGALGVAYVDMTDFDAGLARVMARIDRLVGRSD